MAAVGAMTGIMNGLFGSGGGLIAVPCLKKTGFEVKAAHASAIALTSVFSLVSCISYGSYGTLNFNEAIKFVPMGLAGATVGSFLMKKIKSDLLTRIFGAVMIYSGVRLLL